MFDRIFIYLSHYYMDIMLL